MSDKDFELDFGPDNSGEEDLSPDLISLIDDDGKEYEFEILDSYDCDEGSYIAVIPYTPEEDLQDDGDLMILKAIDDEEEEGEFYYAPIEDDEEFDRISAIFVSRLEEYYDIVEEE